MALITKSMVLAAGMGTRLRPLTNNKPKALVEAGGKPLLAWTFQHLAAAAIESVTVNAWYQKEVLLSWLSTHKNSYPFTLAVSVEETLLESGGGVKAALPLIQPEEKPFYCINCDSLWLNGTVPALQRLAQHWDSNTMDALLLLQPIVKVPSYHGRGDFIADGNGQLRRLHEKEIAAHVYMGIQILHPRLIAEIPDTIFSLNVAYNRALREGRLYGLVHDGAWFHVSTPKDVTETTATLQQLGF